MTLTTITIIVAIAAIIWTLLVDKFFKDKRSWIFSFLQSFVGIFFIWSGFVKAVDPLGTAYKMKDYFGEFEVHFSGLNFLWDILSNYLVAFSVIMIVYELVLGVMLLIGYKPKLSAWLLLAMVGVFTVLTGFTYLTGHVPNDATFLEFSKWGPWIETNMKVTDCGCFGDFIKLHPFTTFMKDVILIAPSLLFLIFSKKMHQLWSGNVRGILTIISLVGFSLYSFSNYIWDLPDFDFRPFKKGVNILDQKEAETKAAEEAAVYYTIINKANGESLRLPMDDYLKVYKKYPKKDFELIQERDEPTIKHSKISEFELENLDGEDATESLLMTEGKHYVVVAYQLKYSTSTATEIVKDSIFSFDTISVNNTNEIVKSLSRVNEVQVEKEIYTFDADYLEKFKKILPKLNEAAKNGYKITLLTKLNDNEVLAQFKEQSNFRYEILKGDDIMLKTIVRSNPGILLMDGATILDKWHYRKF